MEFDPTTSAIPCSTLPTELVMTKPTESWSHCELVIYPQMVKIQVHI